MDGSQGNSNSPPPFLTKTYDMVDDPSTNSVVSWGPANNSFIVWNPPEFSRDLLPKYFKHSNFSSFIRQLNTYGFRKIDPDQWEFSNDEFVRGHKHLLKNIHRRKPIHSHSLQNQSQGGSGSLTEAEKQELEEEIEKLKREKNVLISELQNYTQQEQHSMELLMQSLEDRLYSMELRQVQIMSFLSRVIQRPGFLSNLIQQSEIQGKKRRLPKLDYFEHSGRSKEDYRVSLQPTVAENFDDSLDVLDTEPFEKMESSLNSLENFIRDVSHASREDYGNNENVQSTAILMEIHASSSDTAMHLRCQSPELHHSTIVLGNTQSAEELAESTSYAESPLICHNELNSERSKVSAIDVNSDPTPAEDPLLPNQHKRVTSSAVPTGANDVFWEQFLTETPGSSENQEVQSERRDVGTRGNDSKSTERSILWWNRRNFGHITGQTGHLTSAE